MTDGILNVVEEWTGVRCHGCPWRALQDPYVAQIFDLYHADEKGSLALYCPDPTEREIQGLVFLRSVLNRIDNQKLELERKRRESADG